MIILKPGLNSSVFTLNEKYDFYTPSVSAYPDLYFLFRIKNQLTQEELYFTKNGNQDISPSPERYNEFIISVTTSNTFDPHIGEIGLTGSNEDYLSQWSYEVWGCSGPMPLSGTVSLPTGGTYSPALLEEGRMLFKK